MDVKISQCEVSSWISIWFEAYLGQFKVIMEILEIVIKLNMIIEFLTDILEILTDILEISNCCMYYKYSESFFFN